MKVSNPKCRIEESENGLVLVHVDNAVKYSTVQALARTYGMAKQSMVDLIASLRKTHQITMIERNNLKLVDVKEFNQALIDTAKITH